VWIEGLALDPDQWRRFTLLASRYPMPHSSPQAPALGSDATATSVRPESIWGNRGELANWIG